MLKPFEEATGVKIQYESTRDLSAVLQTRLDGGNPPDVVSNPSMGEMISYAKKGKLVDLSQFLDMTTLKQQYDPSLLNTATVNGKLYSFFQAVNLEGLMWYNPKQYKGPNPPASWAELQTWTESQAAAGQKPWCFGLESGAASGWPGAIWITELLLRQAGPEKYDQLVQGKLAWTSPEVKTAFQTFGKIATDPKMVNGGATAVLSINFANSGDGMYTQPPGCSLVMQSSFMGDIIKGNHPTLKPTEDINFYAFPDIKPEYAGLRQISGEGVGLLKDTPQGRALIKYMASAEASALLAKAGGWLTPNKLVPSDVYPSEFNKQAAKVLAKASGVYYDAGAIIPAAMDQALWKGLLSYLQSPDQLDSILAGLDTVQKDAYK
jgi:alpha-glucoside transport system substrate-binding protein